jgi:hypothetical protein
MIDSTELVDVIVTVVIVKAAAPDTAIVPAPHSRLLNVRGRLTVNVPLVGPTTVLVLKLTPAAS